MAVDVDRVERPGGRPAVDRPRPHAERPGLGRERGGHLVRQRHVGEGGDGVRGAPLLHHDRGEPCVLCAGLEQPVQRVCRQLRREIVDVRGEHHVSVRRSPGVAPMAAAAPRLRSGLADQHAQHVREVQTSVPRSVPGALDPHRGEIAVPLGGAREDRRAGRRRELDGHAA